MCLPFGKRSTADSSLSCKLTRDAHNKDVAVQSGMSPHTVKSVMQAYQRCTQQRCGSAVRDVTSHSQECGDASACCHHHWYEEAATLGCSSAAECCIHSIGVYVQPCIAHSKDDVLKAACCFMWQDASRTSCAPEEPIQCGQPCKLLQWCFPTCADSTESTLASPFCLAATAGTTCTTAFTI